MRTFSWLSKELPKATSLRISFPDAGLAMIPTSDKRTSCQEYRFNPYDCKTVAAAFSTFSTLGIYSFSRAGEKGTGTEGGATRTMGPSSRSKAFSATH